MNAILETDRADILARLNHLGWDYWTTKDHRIGKGSPFSTLDAAMLLLETGMEPSDPILEETARLILSTLREDGRFRQAPSGGIDLLSTGMGRSDQGAIFRDLHPLGSVLAASPSKKPEKPENTQEKSFANRSCADIIKNGNLCLTQCKLTVTEP